MADIDMIPRSWREAVRVRRTLRLAGIALAGVVLLGAAGAGALRWQAAAVARRIDALEAAASQAQASNARDAVLLAGYQRRRHDADALGLLRRAGQFDAFTRALEGALNDRVWLTELTLDRDAQAPAKGASDDGPIEELDGAAASAAASAPPQGWRIVNTLQLKGQAADYAAVTAFLDTLARQPGVSGLRLVGSARGAEGDTIDFQAAGLLVRPRTTP